MRKEVHNEVAKDTLQTRKNFFAAFKAIEEIQDEILSNNKRLDEIRKQESERLAHFESLRKESADTVAAYKAEMRRVELEQAAHHKAIEANREATRIYEEEAKRWCVHHNNATVRRKRDEVKRLEENKPQKPQLADVPEVKPIERNVEARGLVATYDLSYALNNYVLAVAARLECQECGNRLAERLDEKLSKLFDARTEHEKDVECAFTERERAIRCATHKRQMQIATLKHARDQANEGLKQMGIID